MVQGDEDDIEALERDISEESGWKLVHGDVFRPPPHLPVLCALVGTGVQLALLVLATILITIAGTYYFTTQLRLMPDNSWFLYGGGPAGPAGPGQPSSSP